MTTTDTPDWREYANCATTDPDLFFPEGGESSAPAKRVCASCEVAEFCLRDVMRDEPGFGIYGGMSAAERRRLKEMVTK